LTGSLRTRALIQLNFTRINMEYINTVITGTGSYIPDRIIKNSQFTKQVFFEKDESRIDSPGEEVVGKFRDITGIAERRWVTEDQTASQLATIAAQRAIESAGIDPETIDQIIVAENFGDVIQGTIQSDFLPSIASRVKQSLQIKSPDCVAYDLIFGCPGWIQGLIQADAYIRTGLAKRCLIIGTETLSRVVDVYDRDTMIFSDGAGACILEGITETEKRGILSSAMSTTPQKRPSTSIWANQMPRAATQRSGISRCMAGRFTNTHCRSYPQP
jgi:3-oxoacyl-[acyl-carrier-protein] synthase III